MDIIRLYKDFNVQVSPVGHKHTRPGWVNVECPYCAGHSGYHLGYCIERKSEYYNRFVCWRCGGKGSLETVSKILKISIDLARNLLEQYNYSPPRKTGLTRKPDQGVRSIRSLPPGVMKLKDVKGACKYIERRKFDPDSLVKEWDITATGPGAIVSTEDGKRVDYSYRIIIPVYFKGKIVSYQGRDWTGKSSMKYLACLPEMEGYPIKHTLYGLDKVREEKKVRLVEGVTDVWNVEGSIGCYGIKYRDEQVRLLLEFDEIDVLFDLDPQAKLQCRRIIRRLEEEGKIVRRLRLPRGKDPAELNEDEKERILK